MRKLQISVGQFCRLVASVVDSLPEPLRRHLENVVVDVFEEPDAEDYQALADRAETGQQADLLGLFVGVPLTQQGYGDHYPNVIKIFRRPMLAASSTRAMLERNIRATVIHELAHHFGFDEEDLEDFERRQQAR